MREVKPLPVKNASDLFRNVSHPGTTPILETVPLLEMKPLDVSVSFFERVAFYGKEVLPFVLSVLRFYFPIPILTTQEGVMKNFLLGANPRTSVAGYIGAFLVFAGEYLSNNEVITWKSFLAAFGIWLVARLAGDSKKAV